MLFKKSIFKNLADYLLYILISDILQTNWTDSNSDIFQMWLIQRQSIVLIRGIYKRDAPNCSYFIMRFLYTDYQTRNFLEFCGYCEPNIARDIIGYWYAPLKNCDLFNWTKKGFFWRHKLHLQIESLDSRERWLYRSLSDTTITLVFISYRALIVERDYFAVTSCEILVFNRYFVQITIYQTTHL